MLCRYEKIVTNITVLSNEKSKAPSDVGHCTVLRCGDDVAYHATAPMNSEGASSPTKEGIDPLSRGDGGYSTNRTNYWYEALTTLLVSLSSLPDKAAAVATAFSLKSTKKPMLDIRSFAYRHFRFNVYYKLLLL